MHWIHKQQEHLRSAFGWYRCLDGGTTEKHDSFGEFVRCLGECNEIIGIGFDCTLRVRQNYKGQNHGFGDAPGHRKESLQEKLQSYDDGSSFCW